MATTNVAAMSKTNNDRLTFSNRKLLMKKGNNCRRLDGRSCMLTSPLHPARRHIAFPSPRWNGAQMLGKQESSEAKDKVYTRTMSQRLAEPRMRWNPNANAAIINCDATGTNPDASLLYQPRWLRGIVWAAPYIWKQVARRSRRMPWCLTPQML